MSFITCLVSIFEYNFKMHLLLFVFLMYNSVVVAQSANFTLDDVLPELNKLNFTDILSTLNENLVLLLETLDDAANKNECREQLAQLFVSLKDEETWAIKMIDASAKIQSGIFYGNVMHMGSYDECLEVDELLSNRMRIQGQYCTAKFVPHPQYGESFASLLDRFGGDMSKMEANNGLIAMKKSYGFCFPAVCTVENLQNAFDEVQEKIKSPIQFVFDPLFCDSVKETVYSNAAIAAIVVFSTFLAIIVCSTIYDVFFNRQFDGCQLYTAFSLYTNTKKLLSVQTPNDTLGCLNGIRVISMMWIVLGHHFTYTMMMPTANILELNVWRRQYANSFILAAVMSVDTFFTVSGLLVSYLFLKNKHKGIRFSIPMHYVHRLFRLTPSLAMVILFSGTLLVYIGKGPYWTVVYDVFQKPCEKNWWSTLIHLQNYIHTHEQCVGQCWYLAVDTQMYFLSPIILIPLARWPKKTISVLIVLVVLVAAYVFEVSLTKDVGSILFDEDPRQYKYIYSPTHVRGSVYLIGMITGYFVFKTKLKPLQFCNGAVLGMWIFSLSGMTGIVLSHTFFAKGDYTTLQMSFFNALCRPAWAFTLSIMILLCTNGYGGIINSFLSNSLFQILIRLNYNIYLLHLLVIVFGIGQIRTPGYFGNMPAFHEFWGDFIYTTFAAAIWTLAFESPVIIIEKVLFQNREKPPKIELGTINGDTIDIKVIENGTTTQ